VICKRAICSNWGSSLFGHKLRRVIVESQAMASHGLIGTHAELLLLRCSLILACCTVCMYVVLLGFIVARGGARACVVSFLGYVVAALRHVWQLFSWKRDQPEDVRSGMVRKLVDRQRVNNYKLCMRVGAPFCVMVFIRSLLDPHLNLLKLTYESYPSGVDDGGVYFVLGQSHRVCWDSLLLYMLCLVPELGHRKSG
jgi:hypothetical protein